MNQNAFFENINNHLERELPFVCYRNPNSFKVKAILQNNDEINIVKDYSETGFVFAPFNSEHESIIIPLNKSELLECDHCVFDKIENSNSLLNENSILKEKENHLDLIKEGLRAINNSQFQKVVLSRMEIVESLNLDPLKIMNRLLSNYPNAFVYCWFHPKVGLWLGASPETLIHIDNKRFKTMSLAGTQKADNPENNWTLKEKNEQQIVTDFLVEKLKPITKSLQVSEAETVQVGNLLHLKSTISGTLMDNSLNSIIEALHPTPAVCGYPKEAAKEFILKEEHYNREFYTGFIGELNFKEVIKRNKNRQNVENNVYSSINTVTNLFVNLRCMQIKDSKALIYIGGGITHDSIPENEWEETISKSLTIKKVLY